ncbi:MBL fold metallo-hydrolase [Glutamicibacter creatinolyticus]|uniref:MBL fold metallo-hydrolase n=1 Tax=Glutamicibacter creatinolyticus TaxID=162496 RepID=UPI0031CE13E4
MKDLASPTILGPGLAVLRAANPSQMTLEGTNSYLLFDAHATLGAGSPVVLVDPGPDLEEHLAALAAHRVVLVLITHRHADHTGGIDRLHRLTNAPVRALLPEYCRDAAPLSDREVIDAAGVRLQVLTTPGHTSDSVCFLRQDAPGLFTGDTILGRGTTILEHPDGTLVDYLDSLQRLAGLPDLPLHPAHGPQHAGSHALIAAYRQHREQRLEQVRAGLRALGKAGAHATPAELLDLVYPDLDPRLVGAATHSLEAQLHYLAINS